MNLAPQSGLLECRGFCAGVAGTVVLEMRGRGLLTQSGCSLRCSALGHTAAWVPKEGETLRREKLRPPQAPLGR